MNNVESMDHTHFHPSTFASLSNTAHLSPVSYTHHILVGERSNFKKFTSHENIMLAILRHAKQYDNKCSSHVYDDDGSCMAIYLGMAMEMP